MQGWIGLCYNKDVLTITKLDLIIIKYPMATWDYGFDNQTTSAYIRKQVMSVSKQIDVLVMCFCLTSHQALEFILGWLTGARMLIKPEW